MKKIDFNFEILSLEGTAVGNAGKIIGSQLAGENKGEALKYYDWAVKMYKGESISVDAADFKKIKDFIETSEKFTLLLKGPVIRYLDSIAEEKEIISKKK